MKPISKNGLRITAMMVIAVVVAGIWVVKNKPGQGEQTATEADSVFALHVTDVLNLDELKAQGMPIIIDFGADTCVPCKEMAPVLVDLNAQMQGKAIVKFVDVWKYEELSEGYPIRAIPTQIFIGSDGKPFIPKDPEKMQMTLYSNKETGEPVYTVHEGGMTKEALLEVLTEMGVN